LPSRRAVKNACTPKIGEMPGNLELALAQNFDKVAGAGECGGEDREKAGKVEGLDARGMIHIYALTNVSPYAVGAYITAAYWFTASTSFANPAVTMVRSLTNTFSGIRPVDVPAFIAVQLVGAFCATALFNWLAPRVAERAPGVGETFTAVRGEDRG
jgi:hypothetical protein